MTQSTRLAASAAFAALLVGAPALADTASVTKQMNELQEQINAMQRQLEALQSQVKTSQSEAQAAQAQAAQAQAALAAAKPPTPPAGTTEPVKVITSRALHQDGKPDAPWHLGLASADGKNTVELTGRLQLDAGAYNYSPQTAATKPHDLSAGVNARRARIGIQGKFFGDWNYGLIYDFGGSTDVLPATVTTATSTTTVPGKTAGSYTSTSTSTSTVSGSGIENAFIQYAGFKPLYIDLGYVDSLYSLDESNGSNDIMFMERSSPQQIATQFGAGDNRFVFGGHWNNDDFWVGTYATGPTSGALHNDTAVGANGTAAGGSGNSLSAFGRAFYRTTFGDDAFIHIGGDVLALISPAHVAGIRTLSLSDRPELRIDSNTFLSATIPNIKNGQVYSGELAGGLGPFFMQGEYFHYVIQRDPTATSPLLASQTSFDFDGGYFQASYSLTGETRQYNPVSGAYTNPRPVNPFNFNGGSPTGWGAWEIAGRFSEIGLDDNYVKGTGLEGGFQRIYTAGLNWFPNSNLEFMLNYLHGNIDKASYAAATGYTRVGADFNAVAMRARVQW